MADTFDDIKMIIITIRQVLLSIMNLFVPSYFFYAFSSVAFYNQSHTTLLSLWMQ